MGVKITVDHASKTIHGHEVLKDISFTMQPGQIVGFRGKNGSGKTMLLRMLSGLIYPTKGTVMIDGKPLGKALSFPENVGILIENPAFIPDYDAVDNLKMIAGIRKWVGEARIVEVLNLVGLNPEDARKVKRFSLGMKQRLGIAQAILERPTLLLLDEPTNALDREGVERLRKILRMMKLSEVTIGLSSHDFEELSLLCDVIYEMEEGRLYGPITENKMEAL